MFRHVHHSRSSQRSCLLSVTRSTPFSSASWTDSFAEPHLQAAVLGLQALLQLHVKGEHYFFSCKARKTNGQQACISRHSSSRVSNVSTISSPAGTHMGHRKLHAECLQAYAEEH